jgi:hypothetical protein
MAEFRPQPQASRIEERLNGRETMPSLATSIPWLAAPPDVLTKLAGAPLYILRVPR